MLECALILQMMLPTFSEDPLFVERMQVCEEIINEATAQNVPQNIALAVAWQESNLTFQLKDNGYGVYGAMQIKSKYWCLPKNSDTWTPSNTSGDAQTCDFIRRGIFSLKYYLKRFPSVQTSLCAYAGADLNKCSSHSYTLRTIKLSRSFQKLLLK